MNTIAWNRVASVVGIALLVGVMASGISIGLAHINGETEETKRGAAVVGFVCGLFFGAAVGGLANMAKLTSDDPTS